MKSFGAKQNLTHVDSLREAPQPRGKSALSTHKACALAAPRVGPAACMIALVIKMQAWLASLSTKLRAALGVTDPSALGANNG